MHSAHRLGTVRHAEGIQRSRSWIRSFLISSLWAALALRPAVVYGYHIVNTGSASIQELPTRIVLPAGQPALLTQITFGIQADRGDDLGLMFAGSWKISGDVPPGVLFTRNLSGTDGVATGIISTQAPSLSGSPSVTSGEYQFTITAFSGFNGTGATLAVAGPITLVAQPGPVPEIVTQPVSQSVAPGTDVAFSVLATGTYFHMQYTWRRNGVVVQTSADSTLRLSHVQSADAGDYSVEVSNPNGRVTSATAKLAVSSGAGIPAPTITSFPTSFSAVRNSPVSLTVVASGSGLTYQWFKDGVPLTGAVSSVLNLSSFSTGDVGDYKVVVSNSGGSVSSAVAHVALKTSLRLANLSARGYSGAGDAVFIAGFIVQGSGTKRLLLRAWGPTLKAFGVGASLSDPVLELHDLSTSKLIAGNDDWREAGNADDIAAATATANLYPFANNAHDAALLVTLPAGGYTAIIRAKDGQAGGVVLGELQELDGSEDALLVNLSVRAWVGTGESILIPGVIVAGTGTKRILVRAVGPTLSTFGVTGTLADPEISLVGSATGQTLATNDNWAETAQSRSDVLSATGEAGAFALPEGSRDAALVATVPAGGYTVLARGKNDSTGVILVEIYGLKD